jgi:hypothetical protein
MGKIGLVAGAGTLPLEFIRSVKERGERIVVFALEGMASDEIEALADSTYRVRLGKFHRYLFPLLKERIRRIAFLGKVQKNVIYDESQGDLSSRKMMKKLKNKKDTTILAAITRLLGFLGVTVMDTREYLSHIMPDRGVLTGEDPDGGICRDMDLGFEVAKKMSGMDVGQTVIVKDGSVVAVEAMEGTDAAIKRGAEIAGEGCVMVKVSRPDQDYRWDVPAVGAGTMRLLTDNGYRGLAVESNRMYLMDRKELLQLAAEAGIMVKAV